MQSEKSQQITKRFFELLDELVEAGHIHFMNDFYTENDINSRNIYQLRKNPSKDILQLDWLRILVEKYNVVPEYLLTGKGPHFKKPLVKIDRPPRRKYNKAPKSSNPSTLWKALRFHYSWIPGRNL